MSFGISIIKHPDKVPMPDMTKPEIAYQSYVVDRSVYQYHFIVTDSVYLGQQQPHSLVRVILDAARETIRKHGPLPTSLLVDLPCTLFMIETRQLHVVQKMASLMHFAPTVVVRSIALLARQLLLLN